MSAFNTHKNYFPHNIFRERLQKESEQKVLSRTQHNGHYAAISRRNVPQLICYAALQHSINAKTHLNFLILFNKARSTCGRNSTQDSVLVDLFLGLPNTHQCPPPPPKRYLSS